MKNLIVIGAGGFGREVYTLAKECIAAGLDWQLKGFLDANDQALIQYPDYHPILGDLPMYEVNDNDIFIIGITSPDRKKVCHDIMHAKGARFISLIHPTASITQGVRIGQGCIISRNCIISNDCTIGDFVTFNSGAMVGHDSMIGDYAHLNAMAFVGGHCKIGQSAIIHTHSVVVQGIHVGEYAVVGAAAVALRDVKPYTTIAGNPAKII